MDNTEINLQESVLPRRRFLQAAIVALNALVALLLAVPGVGYVLTPILRKGGAVWVAVGKLQDFSLSTPQKATFTYISEAGYTRAGKKGFVWVVAAGKDDPLPVVFSPVCSHTGCNVAWQSSEGLFVCPCHEGRYDAFGAVVSGPPPAPLKKLPVRIENGQLFIKRAV